MNNQNKQDNPKVDQEEWKDIPNYDGIYKVSSLGNVMSINRGYEKILKQAKCSIGGGYRCIFLRKNGVKDKFIIHRLVAQLFIPNPQNKPQVNHINGIKTDNTVKNLEWCTQSENIQHSLKTGLRRTGYFRYDRSKKVINTVDNTLFLSYREAADYLNMKPIHLYRRLLGYTKNDTTMKFIDSIAKQALNSKEVGP